MNFLQESQLLPKTIITVLTDSTSAKSIATRMGVTKLTTHIQLRFLYMQDLVANSIIRIKKVGTKFNCADVMTKRIAIQVLHYHLPNIGIETYHYDIGEDITRPLHVSKTLNTTNRFATCRFMVCSVTVLES